MGSFTGTQTAREPLPVLCVDLDGTLIRSNLLWECLLILLKIKPAILFLLPFWLLRGRAFLKQQLTARVQLDPARLPYRQQVLDLIHQEKLAGRRIALVTAAGQGIGRAIAEAFIAEGAAVIATDVVEDKLNGLKAKKAIKLDVRAQDNIDALAAEVAREFGALNILVNCAGYVHQGTIFDCSDKDWDFSFDLNVKSMHRMIKAFLPAMLEKKKSGSIVNISSAVSSIRGVPNRYAYGATKAAVIGLTKAIAADFIRQGIRCNAICPGTIESPSLDERIAALSKQTGKSSDVVRQAFVDRQPMGRLGTAKEVALLALFLASDDASYITGQTHLVDGGMAL